jgi:hypothetical protein
MKITKTKEVVTEEIEVKPGEYYFEDSDSRTFKMVFGETDKDGYTKYKLETLNNFGNIYSVRVYDDECSSEDVPYDFKQFILGEAGKKITKEEFEYEKQDILKRLSL